MMIGLKIAYVFFLHFLADWALQSKYMSRNKSIKANVLLGHTSIHFIVFTIGMLLLMPFKSALIFSLANAVIHAIIDWYLWRVYKVSVFLRRKFLIPEEKWAEWNIEAPKHLEFTQLLSMIRNYDFTKQSTAEIEYLKKEFKYWDDFWFGFMLGLDQFFHAFTLAIIIGVMLL